jgi:hypothetical protein
MIIRKQIPRYTHRISVSNGHLIVLGGEARPMSHVWVIFDRPIRAGLNLVTAVPR